MVSDTTKQRKRKATPAPQYRKRRKWLRSLKPSPENASLYREVRMDDRVIGDLAESIRLNGLREQIVITKDGFIVSGHRRHAALMLLGRGQVTCRELNVERAKMATDDYLALIRDYNRQRHKDPAEQAREAILDIDPEQAFQRLRSRRLLSEKRDVINGVRSLTIESKSKRARITEPKFDHVNYIKRVLFEDRRQYWPLSVRSVHYALLNYVFLRNTYQKIAYRNDDKSYSSTSDLLTRLRLLGVVPWEAITDGTRPAEVFYPFDDVGEYVEQEISNLFSGYWRNLLQSQPNYVEVLVEKNTVFHMALQVTREFQINTSSGRGWDSIDSIHEIYRRYLRSRKDRLILIVLSDFDPEGERIPHSVGGTLRDDFGMDEDELTVIKSGITREQIERYELPPQNVAKETSSNHQWFLNRNDGDDTVYELEALDPDVMLRDLRTTITNVLDIDLYNAEVEREKEDARYLESARQQAAESLRGFSE